MLDFGIMGQLDPVERLGLVQLFVGLFRQETDRVIEALSDLGIATKAADRRNLARDLDRLRMRYYGLDLEKIRARSFFEDLMELAFSNRLKMPSNLVLVFKAIAMLEGISLQLDPDINVFGEVEPYVREALLELQSPIVRLKEVVEQLGESAEAMMLLPKQLQRVLEQMEAGEGNLCMTVKGLDEPTRRLSAAANRLVLALLAAAFVLGPALLLTHLHDILPNWQTPAVFLVLAGFVLSMLITLTLIVSVWRSGR
jgi:ubiquinone biosynthesis protein